MWEKDKKTKLNKKSRQLFWRDFLFSFHIHFINAPYNKLQIRNEREELFL